MCEATLRLSFSCDSLMQVLCDTILMQMRGMISWVFYLQQMYTRRMLSGNSVGYVSIYG